jgi:hypothetical protein
LGQRNRKRDKFGIGNEIAWKRESGKEVEHGKHSGGYVGA